MIRAIAVLLMLTAPARAETARTVVLGGADVAALRSALVAHPETPDPVGDPASLVVIGFEAGCR